jgi:hypothetical protein
MMTKIPELKIAKKWERLFHSTNFVALSGVSLKKQKLDASL